MRRYLGPNQCRIDSSTTAAVGAAPTFVEGNSKSPSPPGWKSDVLRIESSVPLIKLSAAANFCASEQEDIPTGQSWAS